MRIAIISYWPVFSMSLAMVPEFFAEVKEAQSSSLQIFKCDEIVLAL